MKQFPEFALMIQKWSDSKRELNLTGWNKVRHVLKQLAILKVLGARVTFVEMMRYSNYETVEKFKRPVVGSTREMSFADFEENFTRAFAHRTSIIKEQ